MRSVLMYLLCLLLPCSNVAAQPLAEHDSTPDYRVTHIRFFPAAGHAAEMKGGQFIGSLTSATNDFVSLAEIKEAPPEGRWTDLAIRPEHQRAFRYIKYQAKNDVWADIAELEFYAGTRKLGGIPFGTTGAKELTNDPKRAFDGDTSTAFRGAGVFNQYVGVDLGPASQVPAPAFSLPQGVYATPQALRLTSGTPGARILYSVDGQGRPYLDEKGQPGGGSAWYDGKPFPIAKAAIVQALAIKEGLADSITALAAYRIGDSKGDAAEHAEFHIGNSLTDTVNPWMELLAGSGGHKVRYYRFTIPGAPTDWLWDHAGSGFGESAYAQAFIARAPLTDLITQPFAGHGRSVDNEADYSGRFFDLARQSSPQVQMWLYVQWPGTDWSRDNWANGFSEYKGKKVTFGEPARTWQEAVQNHLRYTEHVMEEMNRTRGGEIQRGTCKPVRILPGGVALAELKSQIEAGHVPGMKDFFGEVFHSPTDFHMTSKGAYLIALVHYACLYHENPEGKVTAVGSGLTPEQASLFQRIAWETARNYPHSGLSDIQGKTRVPPVTVGQNQGVTRRAGPLRILPLGDSITQGGRKGRPEYTYRYPLYYQLKKAGYSVDFIGSLKTGLDNEAQWPAVEGMPFDPDHEGHYGWKTAQVQARIRQWLSSYSSPPDVALIHLGTNDQDAMDYQEAIINPMKDIVAALREANPRIIVLIGHLNFNGGKALKIRPLVEAMARQISTERSPVKTVAHYQNWHEDPNDPASDTFDWAHPNPQGQRKMAEAWFVALVPFLESELRTDPPQGRAGARGSAASGVPQRPQLPVR